MDLFSLAAATPGGAELHGTLALQASGQAGASLRRGVDLSAGIDIRASVSGALGDQLRASLDAGAGAGVGLALQAGFPLDLFSEAGLVARLRAQAEVAGYLQAKLSLPLEMFRELVRERVPGVMGRMLDIFFEETGIEAGMWARAAFAAEVLGEMSLSGSLLSSPGGEAGFTFSARYGAGFGYGAGLDFVANLAIRDPRRLLDRMAEELTALVLSEAEALVDDPDAFPRAEQAMAVGRVLLPATIGTFTHLGLSLAQAAAGQRPTVATRSVVEAFASRAQQVVLTAVFDLAADLLGEHLAAAEVLDVLLDLADGDRADAVEALAGLRSSLVDLAELDLADAEEWLPAMLAAVEAADQLLTMGILPAATLPGLQHALALLWASGTLGNRVAGWFRNPARGTADLFAAAPAPNTDNSPTAAHVAAQLSKPAGSAVTFADLVTFLIGQDPLQALAQRLPALVPAVAWLEAALGSQAGQLLQRLLVDLAAPETLDLDALLESIGGACADAVEHQLLPDLLQPIKQQDPANEAAALVIDELVAPLLVGLPAVAIPRLGELDDPAVAIRLREALSALLLQALQRFLTAAVDVLLDHGLREGEGAIRRSAAAVEQFQDQAPGFAVLAMVSSQAAFGISVTPQDVVGILDLAADAASMLNGQPREDLLTAVGAMLRLGLSTEDTRGGTLATLTGTDDAPSAEQLDTLLEQVAEGAWSMVELIGPRALELVALHFWNQAAAIADLIYEGARSIVAAVEQGIGWLGQQAAELAWLVGELAKKAGELVTKALGDIRALAAYLTTLVGSILDDIRDLGASLVQPLLTPFPEPVREALIGLYNALFDAVKALITAPLQILSAVAGWAEKALTSAMQTGPVTEQQLRAEVADRIRGSLTGGLSFQLRVTLGCVDTPFGKLCANYDAGTVTIPGGEVVGAVAAAVLSDPVFTGTIKAAAEGARQAQGIDAQRENAQKALDGLLDQPLASQMAQDLVVGVPLAVTISLPQARQVYDQRAPLTVRIAGANLTFVQSTLGVPPRVQVRVNGSVCTFTPEQWSQVPDGIELSVQIGASMPEPRIGVHPAKPTPIVRRVEQTTNMTAQLSEDGTTVLLTDPGLTQPGPARSTRIDAGLFRRDAGGAGRAGVAGVRRLLTERPAVLSVSGAVQADVDLRLPPAPTLLQPVSLTPGPDGTARVGRFGVNTVQVSVSDGSSERAAASVVFMLASGIPSSPQVTIATVAYGPLDDEHVLLRSGSTAAVDLSGWTLRGLAGHVYQFPRFTLEPLREVRVYTKAGEDGPERLFWGRRAPVWSARGGAAVLSDAASHEVHRYSYAPGRRQ